MSVSTRTKNKAPSTREIATEQSNNDDLNEEDGEDCYAMMGRRDYQFDGSEDDDESHA